MTTSLTLTTINLGTDDVPTLLRFYQDLLGWMPVSEPDEFGGILGNPAGGVGLSAQYEQFHQPPVWPGSPGQQQMMLHLEIRVDDLDAGVERALQCGARLAEFQPQPDVRVCLDPAGHPFCLWTEG